MEACSDERFYEYQKVRKLGFKIDFIKYILRDMFLLTSEMLGWD